jgi:four helix bundle protein
MKYKTFEELPIFQDSLKLVQEIYGLTSTNYRLKKDYSLVDQIRRAVVSVSANIAEGFERGSNKDFVKFLFYSKGSIGEVRALLLVAEKLDYISLEISKGHRERCISISKQISKFINYLKES